MPQNPNKGRPRKEEGRAVYEALLEAARECLEKKPYHKITIKEVAQRAQTNSAMISYYFGGKGDLFVHLVETMFDELHGIFQSLISVRHAAGQNPNEQLLEMLIPFYGKWLNVMRLFTSEAVLYNTNMRAVYKTRLARGMFQDVRQYLQSMVARSIFRSDLDCNNEAVSLSNVLSNPLHFLPFLAASSPRKIYVGTVIQPEEWRLAFAEYLNQQLMPRK